MHARLQRRRAGRLAPSSKALRGELSSGGPEGDVVDRHGRGVGHYQRTTSLHQRTALNSLVAFFDLPMRNEEWLDPWTGAREVTVGS